LTSTATTHFKLGLFTLLAGAAALATVFGLGIRATQRETIPFHSYFNESVQGLDLGAPVKYRGVPVGSVQGIQIAPDHKLVDVTLALNAADVRRVGLLGGPPGLFAQLEAQGITGVMLVDIDFFDPKSTPVPTLSFQPAPHYIPAAPSMIRGLEESLSTVASRLPALMDATVGALHDLAALLVQLGDEQVVVRLRKAIDDADGAVGDLRTLLRSANRDAIVDKTTTAIEGMNVVVAKLGDVMDRVDGESGLVASTRRATDAIGELGRRASGSTAELERTLRDLGEAARAVRELAEDIDRDPDMLVKGRASVREP